MAKWQQHNSDDADRDDASRDDASRDDASRDGASQGRDASQEDIEALVRAAGGYVRASDDLRPRVLEAARWQRHERRARRWLRHAAVAVLLAAMVTATIRQSWEGEQVRPLGIVLAAGFNEFFVPTAVASARTGDGDWRMLEAFTELRRQQAQVLRLAL